VERWLIKKIVQKERWAIKSDGSGREEEKQKMGKAAELSATSLSLPCLPFSSALSVLSQRSELVVAEM
jgi:hypothetical protein